MDPNGLYPDGFHPSWQDLVPDGDKYARFMSRTELANSHNKRVRYYYFFIDFGLSHWVREDFADPLKRRLVKGCVGLDQDAPELALPDEMYNPFLLDVFIVGNMMNKTFIQVRHCSRIVPIRQSAQIEPFI